jgi:hypothetical protein
MSPFTPWERFTLQVLVYWDRFVWVLYRKRQVDRKYNP